MKINRRGYSRRPYFDWIEPRFFSRLGVAVFVGLIYFGCCWHMLGCSEPEPEPQWYDVDPSPYDRWLKLLADQPVRYMEPMHGWARKPERIPGDEYMIQLCEQLGGVLGDHECTIEMPDGMKVKIDEGGGVFLYDFSDVRGGSSQ